MSLPDNSDEMPRPVADAMRLDDPPTQSGSVARMLVAGVVCAALLALLVLRGLPAAISETAPRVALKLDPNQPGASLALAEADVEDIAKKVAARLASTGANTFGPTGLDAADKETLAQTKSRLENALDANGGGPKANRLRGQIAELEGDLKSAETFMRAAVRGSIRETRAVYWLFARSAETGDGASALGLADTLLRTSRRSVNLVAPVLARIVEGRPDGVDQIASVFATNPPWRTQVFLAMLAHMTDPRTPVAILVALKGSKPKQDELSACLNFLVSKGRYDLAYFTWLQFLSDTELGRHGLVYNGGFQTPFSGSPFDWVVHRGFGAMVAVVPRTGKEGEKALFVEFGQGRVDFGGVVQVLMLGPGKYRVHGEQRGELQGRRGLRWRLSCLGQRPTVLGQSDMLMGDVPSWSPFEYFITVPPEGCAAQSLQLILDARTQSETMVRGRAWFNGVSVTGVP